MFVLNVTRGPDQGKKLLLERGKTYTVGCNEDASLVLTDPLVLKGHCSLEVGDGAVVLRNHTATAGTFVGDQKISQATLKATGTFRVGGTTLALAPAPAAPPAPKPAAPDPLVGRIVGGYKLNEVVGEGGMGKVYRATQLSLHREVAVKVLRDAFAKDKSFRDLFINEARAAAQLVHPNVVQVFDAGSEGDLVFFSMEFLGGGSIEEILGREKTIPWQTAILQILEAAHGLEYAEGKGIVHRDIKPDNLMLNADGRVKIADLGLAKRGEGAKDEGIIGTPHFIPPEQALGKEVDNRADIYSLGATFFRMITGRSLFTGKTAKEIVLKHVKEPPPAASSVAEDVPSDLDLVFAKMLAKEPEKRFQTARELIAALEEVCAHHGIKGAIIRKGVGKRVLIPLVLLLLVAAGAVYFLLVRGPERVDNPQLIREREEAQARAKQEEEKRKTEARERRKQEAQNKLQLREIAKLQLVAEAPFASVYDSPNAAQIEARWLDLAKDFEEFAGSGVAQEFDSELELGTKAEKHAQEIRESLRKWKESTDDRREKKEAKFAEAKQADERLRSQLGELRASRRYEAAANLCDLVATGKPEKEDPFGPVATWEWVSPADAEIRRPALDFPEIKKVVEDSRAYFRGEGPRILEEARTVGNATLEKARGLPPDAGAALVEAAIAELRSVREFTDPEARRKKDEIQQLVAAAREEQSRLENLLKARATERVRNDRLQVRDTQRRIASLDPEQQPNLVMDCDLPKAIDAWNRLLVDGKVETELYRRFAKERIAMLRWCEFLFARFHADLVVTAKGTEKVLRTLDLERIPFPDRELTGVSLVAKDADRYLFALSRPHNRETVFPYGRFPMDWVYNCVFLFQNEPRWAATQPEIEFALGAFCFETMQYKAAVRHFGNVLKVEDVAAQQQYGAAARSFLERADREHKAQQEWLDLCATAERADTVQALQEIAKRLQAYPQAHEGTIFYLDVMDRKDEPGKDFYSPDLPEVPPAPPPPEPIEK